MEDIRVSPTNNETRKHILVVNQLIHKFVSALLYRANMHDSTKLSDPEVEKFVECTPLLEQQSFSDPEYKKTLQTTLKDALSHHYAHNRHHPEHFKNGIEDMNLVDLIEMFCDWKAASLRQKDGNLEKSIELQQDRYSMPREIVKIFKNSISVFE